MISGTDAQSSHSFPPAQTHKITLRVYGFKQARAALKMFAAIQLHPHQSPKLYDAANARTAGDWLLH